MENPHYNHIKATSKRVQNDACISSAKKVKVVLAEKDNARAWLSEQIARNIGTVLRWMTNKVQPSGEQLYDIARHLDVDVRELLVASKVKE